MIHVFSEYKKTKPTNKMNYSEIREIALKIVTLYQHVLYESKNKLKIASLTWLPKFSESQESSAVIPKNAQ